MIFFPLTESLWNVCRLYSTYTLWDVIKTEFVSVFQFPLLTKGFFTYVTVVFAYI